MKITGIYKITSPNNRIYIGQSVNIERRFTYYRSNKSRYQPRLIASFNTYGLSNHIFEIIEICDPSQLNIRERFWQDHFNVLNQDFGLNCRLTKTNDKSGHSSRETIEKIRLAKMFTSEETRLKMSLAKVGFKPWNTGKAHLVGSKHPLYGLKGINNPNFGRKNSFETKELMSLKSSRGNNSSAKIVLDINSGVFYDCALDVAELYNISITGLRKRLSGLTVNNTNFIYV